MIKKYIGGIEINDSVAYKIKCLDSMIKVSDKNGKDFESYYYEKEEALIIALGRVLNNEEEKKLWAYLEREYEVTGNFGNAN